MRITRLALCGAAAGLVACGQGADNKSAKAAAPKKAKTPYCFFKDADTKTWSAKRGKDGNIIVKGKAYRSDPRYKAVLGDPKIEGATAEVRPTISTNDTGFAAADNWWDVSLAIPASGAVDTVDVRCGKKTFAELKVPIPAAK